MRPVIESAVFLLLLWLIVYVAIRLLIGLVGLVIEMWPALVAGSAVGWVGLSLHTYWSE